MQLNYCGIISMGKLTSFLVEVPTAHFEPLKNPDFPTSVKGLLTCFVNVEQA